METNSEIKRVAIVGATGYAGSELTGILARHRYAELVALFSSGSGAAAPANPAYPQLVAQPFAFDALVDSKPDVVFLATPNEASAELVPKPVLSCAVVCATAGAHSNAANTRLKRLGGMKWSSPAVLTRTPPAPKSNKVSRGLCAGAARTRG